ncbi:adenosylcobinamide-phosphate synthase CbiB [Rhodoferax sp. GW822-FHT02A01]|uniref:adenosylcobinamide-phosphate synthase CbiB n=1 Tax=Rhodoferax sp. GW822-FHT02A01 TaxID=3141537 RepID=UPI00315C8979
MTGLTLVTAVLLALAIDHRLGEPPVRWHPVVWIGNYLSAAGTWLQRHAQQDPQRRDYRALLLGSMVWLAGAVLVSVVAWALQSALLMLPWWAAALGLGVLLKPLLAWAMLKREVLSVENALAQSLATGRERLSWLVSRDVTVLNGSQVRESAIETLAENFSDSVVAPLFWFVLLGLPGAALYRFANTADAMWGYPGVYKGRNWAWAGKWAARADDVLNWVPARITAGLLLLASGVKGLRVAVQLPQEAGRTASPNSGWPMAAMALVLGVGLHKPGVYGLNPQGRAPAAADTHAAVRTGNLALVLLLLSLMVMALVGLAWHSVLAGLSVGGVASGGMRA